MPLSVPASRVRQFVEAHKVALFVAGLVLMIGLAYLFARTGPVDIVKNAACKANQTGATKVDCETKGGLAGFTDAADALVSPAIVAMIAIAPLGALVGAAGMMVGNRRGLMMVAASLGTVVFAASLKGIVA